MPVSLVAIDDDPRSLALIAAAVEQDGLEVFTAADPERGIELVRQHLPRIVICDLVMPKLNGMEVLEAVSEIDPTIEVILLTAHYTAETAVEAIRKGASDYLTKPIAPERLREKVTELMTETLRQERAGQLEAELVEAHQFRGIVGRSHSMQEVFGRLRRIAPHYQTVLVTGETGTGKELVARALHDCGPVARGPFAVCNCAALPESLIESELFGYTRGAFTGASQDKAGVFEYANNGTIMLDEIGEMPLPAQAKLLRAIQYQELQRVGSPVPKKVNVRVIAVTNRELRSMVAEQKFREDLLYRLAMVEIRIPPLRERFDDLPLLIRHFIIAFAKLYGKKITGLTRRAEKAFYDHHWPGNVRELEGSIGSAAMMAESSLIDIGDLPAYFRTGEPQPAEPESEDVLISLDECQRQHARKVLEKLHGDKVAAARVLGVSRATLYRLISKAATN